MYVNLQQFTLSEIMGGGFTSFGLFKAYKKMTLAYQHKTKDLEEYGRRSEELLKLLNSSKTEEEFVKKLEAMVK